MNIHIRRNRDSVLRHDIGYAGRGIFSAFCCQKPEHDVSVCDQSEQAAFAVAYRHHADIVFFHQCRGVADRCISADKTYIGRHEFSYKHLAPPW